jgi:hypothetical protein
MQHQPRLHTEERGTTVYLETKAYAALLAACEVIFQGFELFQGNAVCLGSRLRAFCRWCGNRGHSSSSKRLFAARDGAVSTALVSSSVVTLDFQLLPSFVSMIVTITDSHLCIVVQKVSLVLVLTVVLVRTHV